jgi:hypothetical protein
MSQSVWIACSVIGCPGGIGVWHKHADNFRDRFICPDHDPWEVGTDHDEVTD